MLIRVFFFILFLGFAGLLMITVESVVTPDQAIAGAADPCKGKKSERPPECDGGSDGGSGDIQTCATAFGLEATSNCTCRFAVNVQDTTRSTPLSISFSLQEDCSTDSMLVLPTFGSLFGGGHTITATDDPATGGFQGHAVISNKGYRAVIQQLTLLIASNSAKGCVGSLQSAILYDLNKDNISDVDPLHPATRLNIHDTTITTAGPPVCRAIDAIKTATREDVLDRFVSVTNNVVAEGSYEESAISIVGFGPTDENGSEIIVSRNTIGASSGINGIAIEVAPVGTLATIKRNVISGDTDGTGIFVIDADTGNGTTANIKQNNITGAGDGIMVACSVDQASITGNQLNGPGTTVTGTTGIWYPSGRATLRSNKIKGYFEPTFAEACPPNQN